MNEKERLLLKLLVEREHDFVTSQEIATALFVSDRTVRNYIKRMKEETTEHGGEIVAKQGQGYYLKITNKEKFKLFYQKEVMNNVIPKDSLDLSFIDKLEKIGYVKSKIEKSKFKEIDNKVIFLRKLVAGGSEHSFGIHVDKMAGMPPSITLRAESILSEMEQHNRKKGIGKPLTEIAENREGFQLSFFRQFQ